MIGDSSFSRNKLIYRTLDVAMPSQYRHQPLGAVDCHLQITILMVIWFQGYEEFN
jgi:hypothetical protein